MISYWLFWLLVKKQVVKAVLETFRGGDPYAKADEEVKEILREVEDVKPVRLVRQWAESRDFAEE